MISLNGLARIDVLFVSLARWAPSRGEDDQEGLVLGFGLFHGLIVVRVKFGASFRETGTEG